MLLLLSCTVLTIAAGFTTRLLRPDSRTDAAVTFGVVLAAGVAASMLLAGALGRLQPGIALALQAGWALTAAGLAARRGLPRPRLPRPSLGCLRRHPWEATIVALATLALGWQLVVALVLPPFAFDALTYHLTIVASWLRAENIDPTPLSLCCAYYPATSELMFAHPALFLGSDSVVDTVQIGFAALGALSVAGIARSAGLPAGAAAAAAGLFAVTPIVLTQAPTNFADVMVSACALAALHALLRFAETGSPPRLLVAGLATGLVLGTKGTGIIWGAALVLGAVALVVRAWRTGTISPRTAGTAASAFLIATLALGSYWYARNWIETGNPVYPFRVEAAGATVFDGPLRVDDVLTKPDAGADEPWPAAIVRSWAADLDFWNQGSYDYQQRSGGLGPLWVWLALPLLIPLAVVLARRRNPALVVFAAVGLVLLIQPYSWWSRFTIPLAAVGAIAVAAASLWGPRLWMRRTVRAAALALAACGVALSSFEVDPAARAPQIAALDVLRLVGEQPEERTVGRLFFPEYRFLERVPDDATVMVDLPAEAVRFVYPLFGPEFERRVLPSGTAPPRPPVWVVTAAGRPLDRALEHDPRFELDSSERGVRVWAPR